ncbi:MAG: PhoU domain-containing protein [Desulfurococcaceae archaeon]
MKLSSEGLLRIRGALLRMAKLTEESTDKIYALFSSDINLNEREKAWDEIKEISIILENLRKEIVTEVLVFIARRQPLGLELREAQIIISITYDMYRISRYCREIAKIDMLMMPGSSISRIQELQSTFALAASAVKAIVGDIDKLNPLSEEVLLNIEREVDERYGRVLKEITKSETVSREVACKALLMRHIERIVDHTLYIEQYLKELQY